MTLPLFDHPAPGPRRVTLVRLSGELARAFGGIGRVQVEGEVHRVTAGRTGSLYFTLRDRAAQVSVRVPRAVAARSRVHSGERVAVVGSLEWSPDRGQVSLVADAVDPVGEGAIAALQAEVRARLEAAGVLARPRRPLPLLPVRVGVVCGTEAAVIADIRSVVAQRYPGYPLHLETTTVSGPGAASGIVEALERVVRVPGVEVVIVARGGGDSTALLPWSSEEVCLAVAAAPVAVVSAIGHDGDRPLCDEVADLRCGTPSIAAATVVPDRAALQWRCDDLLDRAGATTRRVCERAARRHGAVDTSGALRAGVQRSEVRLDRAGERLAWAHPRRRVAAAAVSVDGLGWRRATWERLARAGGRLDAEVRHLRALAPARVLERGFAVVRDDRGAVVRAVGRVAVGDRVAVEVSDGVITAMVAGTSTSPPSPPAGRATAATAGAGEDRG